MRLILIYLTSWRKEIKCLACRAFYCLFTTSLINTTKVLNRGTCMNATNINLFNQLEKRDKMLGLPSILLPFHKFNKYNKSFK